MYAVSGNIFALWSVWIHVDFFSKNVWQMRISLFGVLNDAGGIFISKLHAENTVFFPIFFLSFYKWICSVSAAEKRILPQQVFYSKKQWLRCSPLPTENYSSCNILQQSDRLSELAYDGLEKCSSFTQKLRAKKFWLIPWVFTYTLILHKYIWIYILHALYIN